MNIEASKTYVIYDVATEEIVSCHVGTAPLSADVGEGFDFAAIESTDYVETHTHLYDSENQQVVMKSSLDITLSKLTINADGVDSLTMSDIPSGSQVFINDALLGICNDGFFDFSTDEPSTIKITVKKTRFLDYEAYIDAA